MPPYRRVPEDKQALERILGRIYCGRCGYDLRTLPKMGRCPECGNDYNSRPAGMQGIHLPGSVGFPVGMVFISVVSTVLAINLIFETVTSFSEWDLIGATVLSIFSVFALRATIPSLGRWRQFRRVDRWVDEEW